MPDRRNRHEDRRLPRRHKPASPLTHLLALGPLITAVGCSEPTEPVPQATPTNEAAHPRLRLQGAGASFPAPLYASWTRNHPSASTLRIQYRQVGSLGGIEAIRDGRVDFGASDIPLGAAELESAGLLQFPAMVGGVVPVVNLPGVGPGELVLEPSLIADIYRGAVTRWDDPAITALNPELVLPSHEILPIHRDDPSGTTWIFTRKLAQCSEAWRDVAGYGQQVPWPTGIGARDNSQVLDFVTQFERTIAYMEFAHAQQHELSWVTLQLADAERVQPSTASFAVAAEGAFGSRSENFVFDTAQAGTDGGWPFTSASYALIRADQPDAARARALLEFFTWTQDQGHAIALDLDYVPVPAEILPFIQQRWVQRVRVSGEPVWALAPPPSEEPPPPTPPVEP